MLDLHVFGDVARWCCAATHDPHAASLDMQVGRILSRALTSGAIPFAPLSPSLRPPGTRRDPGRPFRLFVFPALHRRPFGFHRCRMIRSASCGCLRPIIHGGGLQQLLLLSWLLLPDARELRSLPRSAS